MADRAVVGGSAGRGSLQGGQLGSGRPVRERLREAREQLEAKLLRLEEDERDQLLAAAQPLTLADVERAVAAVAADDCHAQTGLDVQLARRRALDQPILDSSVADDPFAGMVAENRELASRLQETRDALQQERTRADTAERELVRLQMQNTVGLRQLVGTSSDGTADGSPFSARIHLSVRELVEENTQLRAAAASLEEQLLAVKLELALTQEELDRRTL